MLFGKGGQIESHCEMTGRSIAVTSSSSQTLPNASVLDGPVITMSLFNLDHLVLLQRSSVVVWLQSQWDNGNEQLYAGPRWYQYLVACDGRSSSAGRIGGLLLELYHQTRGGG